MLRPTAVVRHRRGAFGLTCALRQRALDADDFDIPAPQPQQQPQPAGRYDRHGVPATMRRQAQTFATMSGLGAGADADFDAFVEAKRAGQGFEEFDQRVERAYMVALKGHKAEIWNAVKRRLKRTNGKYSPQVLMDTNRAIEERTNWLRDVFAQIDADYRSRDEGRQAHAAASISKALRGEPFDYMASAYERKKERRLLGDKGKAALDAEWDDSTVPEMTDEEANRYLNLKPRMSEIKAQLVERYGVAGARHWEMLQSLKDAEYVEKIDRAAAKYKELLDQQLHYDESNKHSASKRLIARIHDGQVRFQTAMELEEERLKLVEAKAQMDKERYEDAKRRRKEALERAQHWRHDGVPEHEIAHRLRTETFDRVLSEKAAHGKEERAKVQMRKRAYLTLVEEMEARFEAKDGERAMTPEGRARQNREAADSVTGRMSDEARSEMDALLVEAKRLADERAVAASQEQEDKAAKKEGREPRQIERPAQEPTAKEQKRALWDIVNEDTYKDPFLTVHQARLDARKTYSDLYAHTTPFALRLAKSDRGKGDSADLAGTLDNSKVMKRPEDEYRTYGWGMHRTTIANLDPDGSTTYLQFDDGYAVKDKETGAIDMRFEKKAGRGMRFTGPRFYKLGIDEDRAREDHPGEQPASYRSGFQRPL